MLDSIEKEEKPTYYQKNKEKIDSQNETPIKCECGVTVRSSYITRHRATPKHIAFLEGKISKNQLRCWCGSIIDKSDSSVRRHNQSQKHKRFLLNPFLPRVVVYNNELIKKKQARRLSW